MKVIDVGKDFFLAVGVVVVGIVVHDVILGLLIQWRLRRAIRADSQAASDPARALVERIGPAWRPVGKRRLGA